MSDLLFNTLMGEPYKLSIEVDKDQTYVIRAFLCDIDIEIGSAKFNFEGDTCNLLSITTDEMYRRQGIGHVMLCQVEGVAKMLGARYVYLEVVPNGVSRRYLNTYFKKHGYDTDFLNPENGLGKDIINNPPSTISRQ